MNKPLTEPLEPEFEPFTKQHSSVLWRMQCRALVKLAEKLEKSGHLDAPTGTHERIKRLTPF